MSITKPVTGKGMRGTVVSFDGKTITLTRSGVMAAVSVGRSEKRIPVASVVAVQFKKPRFGACGFIAFTIAGSVERKFHHENSVSFTSEHADEFAAIREAVEASMGQPTVVATAPVSGLAEELSKLNELRIAGVLTDDEFAAEKSRLLTG